MYPLLFRNNTMISMILNWVFEKLSKKPLYVSLRYISLQNKYFSTILKIHSKVFIMFLKFNKLFMKDDLSEQFFKIKKIQVMISRWKKGKGMINRNYFAFYLTFCNMYHALRIYIILQHPTWTFGWWEQVQFVFFLILKFDNN